MKVIYMKCSACRIAECFAFLVCTKWSNPVIHRSSRARETGSSSTSIRYLDWNSGLVVAPEEDRHQDRWCGLQDIGGHMLKIPVILFQVVLCMYLEVYTTWLSNLPYCLWTILKKLMVWTFRGLLKELRIYRSQYCFLHYSYCKASVFSLLLLNS